MADRRTMWFVVPSVAIGREPRKTVRRLHGGPMIVGSDRTAGEHERRQQDRRDICDEFICELLRILLTLRHRTGLSRRRHERVARAAADHRSTR